MPFHQLMKADYPDKPHRFFIDGVRVNRERFEHVQRMARMFGRQDTSLTKGVLMKSGETKWFHYSNARW